MQAELVNEVCEWGQIYRAQGLGGGLCGRLPLSTRGRDKSGHTYFLIVSVLALEGEAWYTLIQ
jgi:hypothetical protein